MMLARALVISLCCAFACAAPSDVHMLQKGSLASIHSAWFAFKGEHGKNYSTVDEEFYRLKIFRENLKKIEDHNRLYEKGMKSYRKGINRFSDLELSDIIKHKGLKINERNRALFLSSPSTLSDVDLPKTVDWRNKGYVTPVKDQGTCGSCWAFSATGSLEGQHFRKTRKLVSLSEQNLIDCSREEGNEGCDGGLMEYAFEYIQANGGIDTEDSYPYEAKSGPCRYVVKNRGANVTGIVGLAEGREDELMKAVASVGPVSVGIHATAHFLAYESGVYEELGCDPKKLNHGILVVGYGSENGKDYWIIKNSWGFSWGENGYARMARNKDNMCGIATYASYPLV